MKVHWSLLLFCVLGMPLRGLQAQDDGSRPMTEDGEICYMNQPSAQITNLSSQFTGIGACLNIELRNRPNPIPFIQTYDMKCACLRNDKLSSDFMAAALVQVSPDENIADSLQKRKRSVNPKSVSHIKSLEIELDSYSNSAAKVLKKDFKEIRTGIPGGEAQDLNALPKDQCFSMTDYLRAKRAPDVNFSKALKLSPTFKDEDWNYDSLREDYEKLSQELLQEEQAPSKIRRSIADQQAERLELMGIMKSKLEFLYKNPSIRGFFSFQKDDAKSKSQLLSLLHKTYGSTSGENCIISTALDCKAGMDGQVRRLKFEADLAAFFAQQKASEKLIKKILPVDNKDDENKAKLEFDLSPGHLEELTEQITEVNPGKCRPEVGKLLSPERLNECTIAFSALCELISASKDKIREGKASTLFDLEQTWNNEILPDVNLNRGFKKETQSICNAERTNIFGRKSSFLEGKNSANVCGRTPPRDYCNDSQVAYTKYLVLHPNRMADVSNEVSTTPSTINTDVIYRKPVPLPTPPSFEPKPSEKPSPDPKVSEQSKPTDDTQKPQIPLNPPKSGLEKPPVVSEAKQPKSVPLASGGGAEYSQPDPSAAVTPEVKPVAGNDSSKDESTELKKAQVQEDSSDEEPRQTENKPSQKQNTNTELEVLRREVSDLRSELMEKSKAAKTTDTTEVKGRTTGVTNSALPGREDVGQISFPPISGNINSLAAAFKPSAAVASNTAAEKIDKIIEDQQKEDGGGDQKLKRNSMPFDNIQVSTSILRGKQVESLAQVTGEIKNQPQYSMVVSNVEDFKKLQENNPAMIAKYIKEYLEQATDEAKKNGVLRITGLDGSSISLLLISNKSRTYAQQFTPSLEQERSLQSNELKHLQQLLDRYAGRK